MASYVLDRVAMVITDFGTGDVTANVLISNRFNTPAEAGAVNGGSYWWMLEEDNDYQIFEGVYTASGTKIARTTTWQSKIGGVHAAANMALAGNATLRSITPAEALLKMLRVDAPQAFSIAEKSQGRSNISAAAIAAMAERNVVTNPAVDIVQEFGPGEFLLTNNVAKYAADGIEVMYNHGAGTAVCVAGQVVTGAGFTNALEGFSNCLSIRSTPEISSPASGDFAKHRVKVEASKIAHWGWGAANAKSIVVAGQYFSAIVGVAAVKLSNNNQSRCLYHELTVAVGWNFFAFVVPGDTAGTWLSTQGSTGLTFEIFGSGKETTPASSLDAWGSTNKVQTTNSTNLLSVLSATVALTGLYMDVGSQLPTASDLADLMRPADVELKRCQRFLRMSYPYGTLPGAAVFSVQKSSSGSFASLEDYWHHTFEPMAFSPTVTIFGFNGSVGKISNNAGTDSVSSSGSADTITPSSFRAMNGSGGTITVSGAALYNWMAKAQL